MDRRGFLALVGLPAVWPNGALAVRPYCIEHSITEHLGPTQNLDLLWYEDKDGKKLPADMRGGYAPPKGACCQVSRFPCTLYVDYVGQREDGTSYQICRGSQGWSDELALALVTKGGYRLRNAIIIAATACERCMNSLAYACGLSWGYPEHSEAWQEARTSCEFCEKEK